MDSLPAIGLTVDGCLDRQQALREHLGRVGLDTALICDRRHVHYFTGYWCPAVFSAAALIQRDGPTALSMPLPREEELPADTVVTYYSNRLGTLVDDQLGGAISGLGGLLPARGKVGCDGPVLPHIRPGVAWVNLRKAIFALRRRKGADEITLLRRAIAATEAAYHHAFEALRPGVTEVELFAGMQAAAAASAGEVLGEFGNDFQVGSAGGAPRRRPAAEGEVAVLDLSVTLRGYRSDMCRSFVVGRRPTPDQSAARERILEVLRYVEGAVRPGVSCRQVYEDARAMLQGFRGWSFPHHLGHGIGLSAHEAPRLNPHWDDVFEFGDVIAVEPGLYGPDLRAGLRIEEVYHLTENGPERLTAFPTEIA